MLKNGKEKIDDTDMYYVAFGSGDKNLVCLPGLSDGLATVKGKVLMIAPAYGKYYKDYTVYMFSRKNLMPEGYSIQDMADDQVAAMKALGIEQASVLGVSEGGMIAQYIAINHPEVVEKLILTVTTPYANEVVRDNVTRWTEYAKRKQHVELMMDTAEKTYTKHYFERNRRLLKLFAGMTKPKSYERFLRNTEAIIGFDARDELKKVSCPTLIIAGDDDNTVGNKAPYELNVGIQGSELYVYRGLGHGTFEEAKDFYDRILEWMRK